MGLAKVVEPSRGGGSGTVSAVSDQSAHHDRVAGGGCACGAAPGCCDGADALDAGLSGGDGAAVTHSHHLVAGGECHVLGECAVGAGGG